MVVLVSTTFLQTAICFTCFLLLKLTAVQYRSNVEWRRSANTTGCCYIMTWTEIHTDMKTKANTQRQTPQY